MKSYAQNFEDVRLWRAFGNLESGIYIDIGAQDPFHDSVSRVFYESGWRGIHVEPTRAYADALREARPEDIVIEAAVSTTPGPIQFYEIAKSGISTGIREIAEQHAANGWTSREITVPTVTLSGLFDLVGDEAIQWLKIDVEGMEVDVLESWGSHNARPAVLVIEATAPLTQISTHHAWLEAVVSRGYTDVLFDGLSRYFVHESRRELTEALILSPNVFDGFQLSEGHFATIDLSNSHRHALEELNNDAEEARSRAASLETAEASAIAARERAENLLADKCTEAENLINELKVAHAEKLSETEHSISGLEAALDRKSKEAQSLNLELLQLDARMKSQTALHSERSQVWESLRDELQNQLVKAHAAHQDAMAQIGDLRMTVQSLQSGQALLHQNHHATLAILQENIKSLSKHIDALHAERELRDFEWSEKERKSDAHLKDADAFATKQLATIDALAAALSDQVEAARKERERHSNAIADLEKVTALSAARVAQLMSESVAREARQAGEIAQRSADLATFQAENIRLADELKSSNADKQTLIAQFDSEISRIISDSASRESLLRSDYAESRAVIEQIMQERDGLRSSLHTLEDQAGVQQRLLQETVQVLSSQPNLAVTRPRRLVSAMAALFGRTRSAADQEFFTSLNQVNETIANFIESGHGRLNAPTIGFDRPHAGQKSLRELAMLVDESPITDMPRLLALHDVTFVKAAYQALLGRSPDEDGLNYYINRIRLGIHKLEILRQLRSSPEGRSFIPGISGLDRAIKRHRLSTLPVLGALVRPFSGLSSNSANNQYLRSLANSIGRLQNEQLEVSRNTDGLVEKVNLIISKLCEIDRSVCAVRDTTEWVGAHLDHNLPRGDLQASNSNSQFVEEPDRPTEVETKNNAILSVVDTRPTRPLPEHAIRVFSQLR